MKTITIYLSGVLLCAAACHSKTAGDVPASGPEIITPVTVTSISNDTMAEFIELNATSAYLNTAYVKASANGYITSVNAQVGRMVSSQQTVFTLITKEAQSIGNTINLLDTSFKFSGAIRIKAGTSGYVSQVNHQKGEYVQEGEQLAVINDISSFVFILNLPYELRPYVIGKSNVQLILPDGKLLNAAISNAMPVVDSASQTLNVVLKVNEKNLPINLIAKVRVQKKLSVNGSSLPKQAVLSDETQTNFWVMKLLDDSTAVKVPVTKGIETTERAEIKTPSFSATDRFVLTGNYGLADTAKIKIIQ